VTSDDEFMRRLGERVHALREASGWTLDDLSERTGLSRATLSRVERGETSPTAVQLGRLSTAFGRPTSRLLADVEEAPRHLHRAGEQAVWIDPQTGFRRRMVSPPAAGFLAEMVECTLPACGVIAYETAPSGGIEQHIWMLAGSLDLTVDGIVHHLEAGDCLRFHLGGGPTRFAAGSDVPAHYALVVARS
jgi:transcriptional regulator with XRE-family HTH domain